MTAIEHRPQNMALAQPAQDFALLALDRDLARFQKYVFAKESGCHEWIGGKAGAGYGVFTVGLKSNKTQRKVYAHRWAYARAYGLIPATLTIDHLCNNRACVNPAHLALATQYDNAMRGNNPAAMNRRKTHCPAGHEYDTKNTYISKKGGRVCRACGRVHAYQYWLVKKGRAA